MCYSKLPVTHESHRSIGGAVALSLLHLPCCALPVIALLVGAGGAVAPWAARWAAFSEWTLPFAFAVLALSWWRVSGPHVCPKIRRQRWILAAATAVLLVSVVTDHLLLPAVAVAAAR
jgi:hypothetical protein